ncbi:MAG: 23S rRNA (pseudouridine(1915)-N(3))-methyltransferase RlmH [Clostridiales Family XIII bacterium]|nr:23S rRNA (pseudouridine(1915)-N(3))-methyltransferase RlmH [Clostridiales Family XIII bacterium]
MNNRIICVGNLKETYLKDACAEYLKRLTRYGKTEVIELKESNSEQECKQMMQKLGLDSKSDISGKSTKSTKPTKSGKSNVATTPMTRSYICALDMRGELITSDGMAHDIEKLAVSGTSHMTYIIGGSDGLTDELRQHTDKCISFGKITYPHQLMRVVLLEQLYRWNTIISGEKYHK